MRSSIKTKQHNKNGRKSQREYMKHVDMTEAKITGLRLLLLAGELSRNQSGMNQCDMGEVAMKKIEFENEPNPISYGTK